MNAQGKSTVVDESAAISAKAGRVLGIGIKAGTDTASVKIMDGGASGTQKTATLIATGTSSAHWVFPNGIQCTTSIYATVTGTTPEVAVEFED